MRIEEQKRKAVPGLSSNFDVLSTGRLSQQCPLLPILDEIFQGAVLSSSDEMLGLCSTLEIQCVSVSELGCK